ncbi:diaminopimelate epimerase [Enterococcus pallens]|uniref:Diaminopimelate epimerase n=1 Tax=Enterococcus pallens ATCC BAA-351 TaxID=1158607 RepID=R2QCX3_9ENTE|nr:diaminopimelate epimerase [Enterococcus pallens]EOH93083.1 diaminopimelate epimerase [Enterococcus pallens ATCC BAA-351]EOU24869.1 diaminopimelate epimerase [Enterococcus pallens ATCC BAA-351]OJG76746.1 diaminopimelate epimerase [Enterococcus pallens]
MKIPFNKMQGAGNDFIVVNNLELGLTGEQLSQLAKQTCERRVSVGADTLIAIEAAKNGGDFYARYYNSDGSEAEMCGNGARCVARFAYEIGLALEEMVIESIAGDVPAQRLSERIYRVQLNSPAVFKQDIVLQVEGREIIVDYVELGNPGIPHLVVHYPDLAMTQLETILDLGRELRNHPAFEKGANVNFYDLLRDGHVVERTYERGVEDFTLACGTGTGSTAYVLNKKGLTPDNPVKVEVLGGQLQVNVEGENLFLIGDTNRVIEGTIIDENLNL